MKLINEYSISKKKILYWIWAKSCTVTTPLILSFKIYILHFWGFIRVLWFKCHSTLYIMKIILFLVYKSQWPKNLIKKDKLSILKFSHSKTLWNSIPWLKLYSVMVSLSEPVHLQKQPQSASSLSKP